MNDKSDLEMRRKKGRRKEIVFLRVCRGPKVSASTRTVRKSEIKNASKPRRGFWGEEKDAFM